MLEGAGAYDEGALGYGIDKRLRDPRVLEQIFGADGGLRLAPVRLVWGDDGKACKAEVGHGPGRRSYIEGVARGDEDYFEVVALVFSEQDDILAP